MTNSLEDQLQKIAPILFPDRYKPTEDEDEVTST